MKTYASIRILPAGNGTRESGLLHLRANSAEFVSETDRVTIPFDALVISAGGAGNRLVFFSHRLKPELSFYTSDRSVVKDERLLGHPQLKPQLRQSGKVLRKIRNSTIGVLAVFALLIATLYLSKDILVRKVAEKVPVSWENAAGDKLFSVIRGQYTIIENDSLKKVFLEVAEPLLRQVRKKGVQTDLYFVADPSINAFALPGGKVVIQSGLIANAESWEEVLGVLAHELAHVTERHHMRGIITNMGLYAIVSAIIGDMSAIGATIANTGGELASLSNSRAFETEADETGWKYLVQARIDPSGMISFFETLDRKHGTAADGYLSFLSTHPETKERIAHLKAELKEHPVKFAPIGHDFAAFKKAFNQQQ